MKKFLKTSCYLLFSMVLLGATGANANDDFNAWKKLFYQQALSAGIKKKTLDRYVPQMDLLPKIIEQDIKLPEYIPTFESYVKARLTKERIDGGHFMAARYPSWLRRVSEKYGVPSEYLLALWGMETNYGSFMGKVDMLDSLASLAYHPRRRKFFTDQLISYLKILETEPVPPVIGSWDAGFGHFQFMPSTFEVYAVDGDGNGSKNLVSSIPDALSSAANYLNKLGWNPNEPWGREVILPPNIDWSLIIDGDKKTVQEWKNMGVQPVGLNDFPQNEMTIIAGISAPMGTKGPAFITYPNFKRILNWNRYELYALSTGLLADTIAGRFNGFYHEPSTYQVKSEDLQVLQSRLIDMGYYTGKVDGKLGKNTRHAIQKYQQKLGIFPDGYPDESLINLLTNKQEE